MSELLKTWGLGKHFGGLRANHDINFTIHQRTIHSIIGPNGAGKTTFISMISGHHRPSAGRIWFAGEEITDQSVIERARRGIVRKFQRPSLYLGLTAYENVEVAVLATGCPRSQRHRRIHETLEQVRLAPEAMKPVSYFSHGQRQWLEVALLLAREAKLLLLDEPTAGMTSEETNATGRLIRELVSRHDCSAIIIEHDLNFVRNLQAPVTVMHLGEIVAQGSYHEVEQDDFVRSIYLGQ
jgi:ABC-type uncharacterized transport system ATPase subunit